MVSFLSRINIVESRKILHAIILLFLTTGLAAQHDISKYKLNGITDPVLPLITNRVIDTIQHDWMVLLNEIDQRAPLKLFIVEADGDSLHCDRADENILARLRRSNR